MGFLLPDLDYQRMIQDSTMIEEVEIWQEMDLIGVYPCRVTSFRLFAEPADPYDANVRSFAEWGFTLPMGTPVLVGQTLRMPTRIEADLRPIEIIVGEVVQGDTWQTAVRAWGNKPKTATPCIEIVIERYDGIGERTTLPAQKVQIVYDRVTPTEVPVRYQTLGRSAYQGGTVIGDIDFDVEAGDRFILEDTMWYAGHEYVCWVVEVLPLQPQRREARFRMDVGGAR